MLNKIQKIIKQYLGEEIVKSIPLESISSDILEVTSASNSTMNMLLMRNADTNQTEWVSIGDILYAETPTKRETCVNAAQGKYKFGDPNIDLIDELNKVGFGIAGKKMAVNIERITHYDSDLTMIYFDGDMNSCLKEVGVKFIEKVKKSLRGKAIDVAGDSQYAPINRRK